jgi:hypothetical protein
MEVVERFPFGAPIQPVTWQQAGPKPVMVIGVYPSAVHARWVDVDGRTRIRAVAMANEPEPFWTGQDADDHIAAVTATVPTVVGRLVGAPGHNGPSGQALDASVLAPLGLDRDRIRVADIDNRYMANPAQQQALERCYNLLVQKGLLPPVSWRPRRPITKVPADRSPSLAEELEEARPDWVMSRYGPLGCGACRRTTTPCRLPPASSAAPCGCCGWSTIASRPNTAPAHVPGRSCISSGRPALARPRYGMLLAQACRSLVDAERPRRDRGANAQPCA